jgi:cation diffusion facilitator CzcD-associated flavoprotein CzcO
MSRILVVGAGPAGLATAIGLACHDLAAEVEVVDPAGRWLSCWDRRFAAQGIEHLRSPAVHHPHPEPFALLESADRHDLVPSGGTQLPTTTCFARFVGRIARSAGVDDRITRAAVTDLQIDDTGGPRVTLGDGTTRSPDRLVLATNARRPAVPSGLRAAVAAGDATTGDHADLAVTPVGGHVVVVGGGLSAGHLVLGAIERGATVTLVTRRRLMVRRFDTHPSWLGPKKRRPFEQEPDPHVRRRTIEHARGGGSVPHRVRRALDDAAATGRLDLRERVHVVTAIPAGSRTRLCLDDGSEVVADAIWLATGGAIDADADPLCRTLARERPTTIAGGLPDLAPDLTWPGTRVHLAGAAAALVLGPTAGNLIGHRRAASRIVAAVRGLDPRREDRIVTGAGACPQHPPGAAGATARSVPTTRHHRPERGR